MKVTMFLYVITNCINSKQYVGITNDPEKRWATHRCGHGSNLLFAAIKKYGEENFDFDILYTGGDENIKQLETITIKTLETLAPSGYNLTTGGEGKWGCKPTKETRQKMSQSRRGKHPTLETRKKLTEVWKSPEYQLRQRVARQAAWQKPDRQSVRQRQHGGQNPNAKAVLVSGIKYSCLKDAAKAQKVCYQTLLSKFHRCKLANSWPDGFGYLDKSDQHE